MRLNMTIAELNKVWLEYHQTPRVTRTERFGQYLFNRYCNDGQSWPALFYAKDREAYRLAERDISIS